MSVFNISKYIASWLSSPFAEINMDPWLIVRNADEVVGNALQRLNDDFVRDEGFAIHRTARIEAGVILKGAGIIGARSFVASGSYLRGGAYIAEDCIVGPNSELKSSFMFAGSKIAHLNFVGDSIIGSGVNIEAGAIIANYRNEFADKQIRILSDGLVLDTGVDKFGALVGDHVRIGANSVVAPGAVILPETKIGRLQLVDQHAY